MAGDEEPVVLGVAPSTSAGGEADADPATPSTSDGGANAAAAAAQQDPEARFRYDEALLILDAKGKVRRPVKPDEQERNLTCDKLKAEIEKRSARIKEIKEIVEQARSARTAGQAGNQEIIKRLQILRTEFQTVLRQKAHIREDLQATLKTRDELRASSRQLRDRLPKGVTADTVDAKIAELEYKQQHESGADDKALIKRIAELTAAKPQFKEFVSVEASLRSCEDKRAEIQRKLQECDAVLTDVKAREEVERSALDALRSKQAENEPNIGELNVEKKECWDIIQALRAKMDEVRKAFSEKYTEYIKLDRNYNNYIRFKKRQEWEERQRQRAERDAAENGESNGGAADAAPPDPYASEVFTLDQLTSYLRKLLPPEDKGAAGGEGAKKEVAVPQGMKLLKKKDEDEGFMAVTRRPKGKKGGSAGGAPAATADVVSPVAKAADPAKKKLNHGLDTLKTFMQFRIDVPQTAGELPATIEKVLAKKEYYLELRRTGKKPEPPPPEPEPEAEAEAEPETVEEPEPEVAEEEEEQAQAPAPGGQPALPTDGLGLALVVDQATAAVSVQLTVGA